MNKRNLVVLLSAGLLFSAVPWLTGCSVMNKIFVKTELPPPVSAGETQPADIPIPHLNFTHRPEKSIFLETVGVRTASIKYEGSAHLEDVVAFYETQMPLHKWQHQGTISADSLHKMAFTRKREKCEVTAENKGSDTYLTIKLNYLPMQ